MNKQIRIPNAVFKTQKPTLAEWLAFAKQVGAHDAVVQAVAKDWDKLEASYLADDDEDNSYLFKPPEDK
jgi:hypothetical protein